MKQHKLTRTQNTRAHPWLLCTAAVLWLFAAPAAAQTDFGTEIEVQEAVLDVLVTDEQGKVVPHLDEDDFIVREEGEPAEIRDVTFYSDPQIVDETPGTLDQRRYFILFFHHQRTLLPRLAANLLDAGRRAEQWVGSSLQPGDYVAVVSYFPKYNLLDFTDDVDVLKTTIQEAVTGRDFTAKDVRRPAGIPSLVENLPSGDADRIYEALAMTAQATADIRGRKNLVLFSIGFGEVDSFGFYRPDTRYYPDMIRTLNDANVSVYPVDLLATDISPVLRDSRFEHVLTRMAMESGGRFFYNFTNYLTPLEQTAEDNRGYYLIAFTPTGDPEPGEYREVDVETMNANYDTRAREGYVAGHGYPYGTR